MKTKPVIGVLSHKSLIQGKQYAAIYYNYVEAVFDGGGTPILIPLFNDEAYVNQILEQVDGILIPGGIDMHPKYYNEPLKTLSGSIDPLLDEFELKVIQSARQKNIPILGICRGMQVLNVAFNGSLYQDISYYPNFSDTVIHAQNRQRIPEHEAVHDLQISPESILHPLYGDSLGTNSYHHQIVNHCGDGLKVTAQTEDGVVEVIESTNEHFVLGVQWHPEKMYKKDEKQLKIFELFVEVCQNFNENKHI